MNRPRMGAAAAVILAAGALLAGQLGAFTGPTQPRTAKPWAAFRQGKVVAAWSVDGGRLVVEPTRTRPRIDALWMAARLAASDVGDTLPERVTWGYGRVSIDPRTSGPTTARFEHRDAWIAVASGLAHGCRAMSPLAGSRRADVPDPGYTVLVLAQNGLAGAVYTSGQESCGRRMPPRARPLTETSSLEWTAAGPDGGPAFGPADVTGMRKLDVSVVVSGCPADVSPQGVGYDRTGREIWQVLSTRILTGKRCDAAPALQQVRIRLLSSHTRTVDHGTIGLRGPAGPTTTGARLIAAVSRSRR